MKKLSHAMALVTNSSPAIDRLEEFLEERKASKTITVDFEQFEKDIHEMVTTEAPPSTAEKSTTTRAPPGQARPEF
ncbi:MAG: hypothetical protein GY854_13155 [Deltaproteobacteria bacterium]|nr:hypothetical protein [Deltaproteobacteria bacterium]